MKTIAGKRLFWFLKDSIEIDLSDKRQLDIYVQQILSRGKTSDIRNLLKLIDISEFKDSFRRIKNFLEKEVKMFWEEYFGKDK
ncbi:MAG: hypothetical protein HY350_03190 [Candidatus Omnitrophica bacterium]|nr:hypothetical protein [Candidatus Omnitrophota bacterium]